MAALAAPAPTFFDALAVGNALRTAASTDGGKSRGSPAPLWPPSGRWWADATGLRDGESPDARKEAAQLHSQTLPHATPRLALPLPCPLILPPSLPTPHPQRHSPLLPLTRAPYPKALTVKKAASVPYSVTMSV
jgi:hypothetical protein